MHRVTQTIVDRGRDASEAGLEPGDCMRAATASIFELPLATVPHFCDTGPEHAGNGQLWWYAFSGWALSQGAIVQNLTVLQAEDLALPGYMLLSGVSPREKNPDVERPLLHCCVGWNGQIAWDPHPSRDGLRTIDEADYLIPITDTARALLAKAPA